MECLAVIFAIISSFLFIFRLNVLGIIFAVLTIVFGILAFFINRNRKKRMGIDENVSNGDENKSLAVAGLALFGIFFFVSSIFMGIGGMVELFWNILAGFGG